MLARLQSFSCSLGGEATQSLITKAATKPGESLKAKMTHRVFVPFLLRIVWFPATGGEDVLVLLIPAPQHHFASMRLQEKEHSCIKYVGLFLHFNTNRID